VEAERRERNVRLLELDPARFEANTFHVTDEFRFENGTPPNIRLDVVFLINGIPILTTETKAAREKEGVAKALDDIRHYHKHGPELLVLTQLFAMTDLERKWGSCSTAGRVTFDTELLTQPAVFRRKVIVHELLHLKVPNHGRVFRALLRAYLGDAAADVLDGKVASKSAQPRAG
jgi:hypothetical protein